MELYFVRVKQGYMHLPYNAMRSENTENEESTIRQTVKTVGLYLAKSVICLVPSYREMHMLVESPFARSQDDVPT